MSLFAPEINLSLNFHCVRNEFLAVRNAEGSFYVCQAMQNIYKSSRRIRIRWLSQDKTNGEYYSPDFYDTIGIVRNMYLQLRDNMLFVIIS